MLTSAGLSAGIDLSLHVIRADHGITCADHVARHLVAPPHREGGQAQYFGALQPTADPGAAPGSLEATRDWAREQNRRAAHRRGAGPPRQRQPAHLRPPLPRRDRHDAAAVAALPPRDRGASPPRGVRSAGRDHPRPARRLRQRRLAARPLSPRHGDHPDRLPAHFPVSPRPIRITTPLTSSAKSCRRLLGPMMNDRSRYPSQLL